MLASLTSRPYPPLRRPTLPCQPCDVVPGWQRVLWSCLSGCQNIASLRLARANNQHRSNDQYCANLRVVVAKRANDQYCANLPLVVVEKANDQYWANLRTQPWIHRRQLWPS